MKRRTDKEIAYQYIDRLLSDASGSVDEDLLREILGARTTAARVERLKQKVEEALLHLRDSRVRPYLAKRGFGSP